MGVYHLPGLYSQEGWPKAGVVDQHRAASLQMLAKPTVLNAERFAEICEEASRL